MPFILVNRLNSSNSLASRFNLRVYGIVVNLNDEVLLSHESRNGFEFTKFPGGGVEFGEGLGEALNREFLEEIGVQVKDYHLFYVNDFFQPSAFNPADQLVSFYFLVTLDLNEINTNLSKLPKDAKSSSDFERVSWHPIQALTTKDVTFPIDQEVLAKLKATFPN